METSQEAMKMSHVQRGILAEIPPLSRYLTFTLTPGASPERALMALRESVDGESTVMGLGHSLISALGVSIEGMRVFPAHSGSGIEIPSTPAALWLWLRGDDRGELLHRSRALQQRLAPAFTPSGAIDAFRYREGRDLTGYEDGTENPKGEEASAAAVVSDQGEGLDGGSFVAVQQWRHDLDRFASMSPGQRDHTIGRRISDNEEIEDAPESAHVKRTAQEDFEPAAFIVRRSMPWHDDSDAGLVFVAFGHSLDAYEKLLKRMMGGDDGITDALFTFTRPLTGSYYWCPPIQGGRLDLRAVGLGG